MIRSDGLMCVVLRQARSLKAYGELPESAKINETDTYGGDEEGGVGFDFGDDESDSGNEIDVDDI